MYAHPSLGSFRGLDVEAGGHTLASPDRLHPRAARLKLQQANDYLAHLEFARRAKLALDGDDAVIADLLVDARNQVNKFSVWADAPIAPRHRVPVQSRNEHSAPRHQYLVFLDECGSHHLRDGNDPFPVFCLCAIIVDRERYMTFDRSWKTWKSTWLGSSHVRVHEPVVRAREGIFHSGDPLADQARIDALAAQLADLEYTCIAAVIDKPALRLAYPTGEVDDFLPRSAYLMSIDFVLERAAHYLYNKCEDAQGLLIAEARGPREDAEVQHEFLRLHLQGTQYVSDSFFRNQFRPYMEFHRKDKNGSGLQIADILARPIAEKIMRPDSTPERWQVAASKLYDGGAGRKSSYGLKTFPGRDIAAMLGETEH